MENTMSKNMKSEIECLAMSSFKEAILTKNESDVVDIKYAPVTYITLEEKEKNLETKLYLFEFSYDDNMEFTSGYDISFLEGFFAHSDCKFNSNYLVVYKVMTEEIKNQLQLEHQIEIEVGGIKYYLGIYFFKVHLMYFSKSAMLLDLNLNKQYRFLNSGSDKLIFNYKGEENE